MTEPMSARLLPGRASPLGAHVVDGGIQFAVFSQRAKRIELCVFDASGTHELKRYPLTATEDGVFSGVLPDAQPGLIYGYRAYGSWKPESGYRFNPHKLLLDPYARQLEGRLRWSDALMGYKIGSPRADLSFDTRDSAFAMPKSVVVSVPDPTGLILVWTCTGLDLSLKWNFVPEN